jgi:hypothetical protein
MEQRINLLTRIKSGVSSLIGLLGAIAILAHSTGFYEFPNPKILSTKWETCIGLSICAGLWYLKDSEITDFVRQVWNGLIGLFKKKTDA